MEAPFQSLWKGYNEKIKLLSLLFKRNYLLKCSHMGSKSLQIRVKGFPGGSDGKECACNVGYPGSIPGLGRSPGEGNGYAHQCSCLENLMDWETWDLKELDIAERLTFSLLFKHFMWLLCLGSTLAIEYFLFLFFNFFTFWLYCACSVQDLSSLTRDWTCTPFIGRAKEF